MPCDRNNPFSRPLTVARIGLLIVLDSVFRAGVQLYTRASGHARIPGLLIPSADID
jgi:hypothetical protein